MLISFVISIMGWIDLLNMSMANHFIPNSIKWMIILGISVLPVLFPLVLVIGYWMPSTRDRVSYFLADIQKVKLPEILRFIVVLTIGVAYSLLLFSFYGRFFEGIYLRIFLVWNLSIIGAICIGKRESSGFLLRIAFTTMVIGFGYAIISLNRGISSSAFTLGWSEASRYYYASLFASSRLYGQRLAWPFLHPSRYILQSIPFIIADFPIVVHRFWQAFLWVSLPLLSIWVFLKRIVILKGYHAWVFLIWSFLFLYQGPVYYHLFVCILLVILGYQKDNIWKTTIFVVLASLWAGISRVNWFPVPAMVAIILYLLDHPFPGKDKLIKYFIPPVLFTVLGLISAFGSQVLYALLSSEEHIESFGSSFTSDLLWYRLFPNATSQWGIVLPILFLTLPVLVLLIVNFCRRQYSTWQWFPIWAIVFVLFAGGLVVSTKIGGGGNLHNLDAWLVILWILVGKLVFDKEMELGISEKKIWRPTWLMLVIFLLPFVYHIDFQRSYTSIIPLQVDIELEQEEKESILKRAAMANADGQEILFISQRQLLMFEGKELPLTDEYELLTLMEMAISNNQPYLEKFSVDLQNHRFGIIIVEKQAEKISNRDDSYFSEENNAWVKNITIPLLQNYEEVRYYSYSHLTILEPKQ